MPVFALVLTFPLLFTHSLTFAFADNDNKKHTLQAIDIIVIVVAALLVAVGAALILKKICTKVRTLH